MQIYEVFVLVVWIPVEENKNYALLFIILILVENSTCYLFYRVALEHNWKL
jgi:hypothetical protein